MADVTTQTVILEFDAKTGEVLKATKQLENSMEGVADAAENAADATEDIGKSAKKSGGGLSKMGKLGSTAFKGIGTAIKATGIGLLVGLVAQLIAKFAENKKVADILQVALAGLGAVFNTIIDAGTWIIDNLVSAFQNPQEAVDGFKDKLTALGDYLKTLLEVYFTPLRLVLLKLKEGFLQAAIGAKEFFGGDATELRDSLQETQQAVDNLVEEFKDNVDTLKEPFVQAAEAVTNYVATVKEAITQATTLEKELQRLRDAQRDNDVAFAQAQAQLESLKKTRDDERLSIEERIQAAEKAQAMEREFTEERVRLANETVVALEQEIALQGATEERLQEVADARIAAADALATSAGVQTEFMTSIFALEQEALAVEQEVAALRREFQGEVLEGYAAEKQAILDQLADRQFAIEQLKVDEETKAQLLIEAKQSTDEQIEALDKAHQLELAELAQKALDDKRAQDEKDIADEIAKRQAIQSVVTQSLSALSALNKAFGGASEQELEAREAREIEIEKEADAQKRYQLELTNYELNQSIEKEAKKQFDRGKALEIADATIATGQAAIQAYKSMVGIPVVGPGLAVAAATAASLAGAAQIKSISAQNYESPAAPAPPPTTAITAQSASGPESSALPQIDLSFLGEGGLSTDPIQAYVLSESVTTAQQANQQIQQQASL